MKLTQLLRLILQVVRVAEEEAVAGAVVAVVV
jgi:hypothetical protein